MDKKRQIKFNLNSFLISTSFALDCVQKDKKGTSLFHSKRVAYIALNMGAKLGLNPQELADLCSYCLCHHISLNQSDDDKSYCEKANSYVKNFPFLQVKDEILKYQKENFDGSGIFGLKGDEIPLFSQLIYLASTVDEKFDLFKASVEDRTKIKDFIKLNENVSFSEELVKLFLDLSSNISFWLDLKYEQNLILFIYSSLYDFTMALDFEDLLKITKVFSQIENPNSKLVEFTRIMCEYYGFEHKDTLTLQIAASLSKIGKLCVDEEIEAYPYYTKQILSNILAFDDINSWASKIEEKIDASGYCFALSGKDLSFKDRLLGILNIYDSLITNEKYTHIKAIEIIEKQAQNKKLDISILEDISKILK
ncbi:MAG: hypothetical protein KGV43_03380 [Arcobacter sp.]|nr:hypothetical protein [Arcobacter sp.]